ncbi:hypothetical protein GCM10027321_19320 [Massilia terrae]|uniref:DUF4214 domain-containing protein n=1 Tax=Massilia terrae TaxID=1811224 RepID=A0ABT2CWP9_9BURK|nr:DUF4214 domain-containing protein [Massilia terrae]MCS0658393.1 DUF4214 domain-containing protein [Massilia terrae]
MADNTNAVEKLYIAYFSRPADFAGLQYWSNVLATNPSGYQVISSNFAASAEYKAAYANQTNAQIVSTVYQHLFGRAAEQAGVDYWAKLLDAKTITIDNVVTQIANGAQSTDLFAYNAKVSVATTFTAHLDTSQEQAAYSGNAANAIAINFIATIKDLASAAAASDPGTIDGVIAQIVGGGTTTGADFAHLPVY